MQYISPKIPIALFLLLAFIQYHQIKAQTAFSRIMYSGETLSQITEKAEAYFQEKHPTLKLRQLAEGEYRDGEYVKYMRWRHFWQDRLNPDGTLGDPTAYFLRQNNVSRATSSYADMEWRNTGLTENLGGQIGIGRTTAVEFHPTDINTFWVATAMGGVWKTHDGGQTYTAIGDNLPTLATSDILADRSNPNTIYVGTGDRVSYGLHGIGVMKSIDGGNTWQTTALQWPFSDFARIYALEADPTDPQTIYAATDKGLYKTTDGFISVDRINNARAFDVRFKPNDPNILYYTAGSAFWKSTDGGNNFAPIKTVSQPLMMRITVSKADPNRVYFSNRNELYQSYDSGNSFQSPKDISAIDNGLFGYCILSEQNPDVIYGGYFNTWKSTDNGSTWNAITCFSGGSEIHVDNHFAAINPLDPSSIYFCNDGGLYSFEENDCGDCRSCFPIYRDLSAGMFISQYYDISNSQQSYNLIGGGTQDNGSFFRNKSGQWQFYAPTGDGMVGAIDPTDDNFQYWTYQFGSIFRYSDGGNSCISCNIPNDEHGNGAWITPYLLDPNDPATILAGFRRVYKSTNRGNSWTAISDQLANGQNLNHLAIAPSNSSVVYAIHNGSSRLLRTDDADQPNPSWITISLPFSEVSSIAVDIQNENRVYISRAGFSEGSKIFRSDDGGQSWNNISGSLPNVPANVVKMVGDPSYQKALFVGTDAGVFYRDVNTDDWEEYGDLAHTYVRDIEFQYTNKLIRIGTYGRALYEAFLPNNPCLEENPPDADQDGVCDALDICPGGDDLKDNDGDGIPDDCESYCEAIGSPGTGGDYITNVSLHTLMNGSGKTPYSDFTNLSTTLEAGESYTLTIRLNFSFDPDTAYGWIDFNQNKEFEPSEGINMSGFNNSHESQGTFTVPADALPGPTRLRVRNIYPSTQPAAPCNSYFGEVEDYTVDILNINADFTASETNPCTGESVQFSSTVIGIGTATSTYNWTFPGGIPDTSTEENPTIAYDSPGNYDVSLTVRADNLSYTESKNDYITVKTCGPDWVVTETGDNHSVIVESGAEILIDAQAISIGDYIGAFYDDNGALKCAGKAQWTGQSIGITIYGDDLTTGTVKEGFSSGEQFQWKLWRASDSQEFDGVATYAEPNGLITHTDLFAINGISSIISLIPTITQTITIQPGWNIISTYVEPDTTDLQNLFEPIESLIIQVKNDESQTYIPSSNINSIGEWNVVEGYQIKISGSEDANLQITGRKADLDVPLAEGWNLIAYHNDREELVNVALSVIVHELDLVKDEKGMMYIPEFNINNIGNLKPGEGYWAKAKSDVNLDYNVRITTPPVNIHTAGLSPSHFNSLQSGSDNATMILDTKGLVAYGDEIGVFNTEGLLIGSAVYEDYILAFPIWGDDPTTDEIDGLAEGARFEIRVWNQTEGSEAAYDFESDIDTYTSNGVIKAELLHPTTTQYILQANNLKIYPNPTNSHAILSLSLKTQANVEATIFDFTGQHVFDLTQKQMPAGNHEIPINTYQLSDGLYHCRILLDGKLYNIPFSVMK